MRLNNIFPSAQIELNQYTRQAMGLALCWPGIEPRKKSLLVGQGNLTLNNIVGKRNSLGNPVTGFNGSSSYISVPEYAAVDIPANGTVFMSAWYIPDADGPGTDANGGYFVCKGNRTSDNKDSYALLVEPSGLSSIISARIWNGSGLHGASITLNGNIPLNIQAWLGGQPKHVCGGYDGVAGKWWVGYNGQLRSSSTDAVGPINTNEAIYIGAYAAGGTPSRYINAGSLWDVRIYNIWPSNDVISDMFERPNELYTPPRRSIFWVSSSAPALSNVSPSSGTQGTTASVTITGTNLTGGTPSVSGSGVTVTNVVVVDPTSITCDLVIAGGAAAGARNLTVTTSLGTSNAISFTVNTTSVPAVSSITPNSAYSNPSSTVTLTGVALVGTQLDSGGSPIVHVPAGFSVANLVVSSAVAATFDLTIGVAKAAGSYSFTFENANGESNSFTFTVNSTSGGSGGGSRRIVVQGGGLIFS